MEIKINYASGYEVKELVKLMNNPNLLDTPQYNLYQNPKNGNYKLNVLHKRKRRCYVKSYNVAIVDNILIIN